MKPVLKIAVILLFVGLLGGCATMGPQMVPPGFVLTSLRMTEAELLAQRYELGVRLQNPNRQPLVVEGLRYELELNGDSFAKGASAIGVTVPAYGEVDATLQLSVSTLKIAGHLMAWMENPPEVIDYRIQGQLDLRGLLRGLPFETTGQVSLGPGF